MKKLLSIFGMLMLLVNMVAAAVVITPENPDTADNLTCDVSGSNSIYNYYWYRNDARVKTETGRSSTLPASVTRPGDEIECRAFRPSTAYTPETYVGKATTEIEQSVFTGGLIVMRNRPYIAPEQCEGPECQDLPELPKDPIEPQDCEGPECQDLPIPPKQCNDGIDNDGDGFVDMNDPGCSDINDNDEWNYVPLPEAPAQCNDGVDNDGDGFVDMNDPGCSSPLDNNEHNDVQNPACSDGFDNDQDGFVDMNDPGCTSPNDSSEQNDNNGGSSSSDSGARSLDLDMVYAIVDGNKLTIEYILENDGTMSVKGVELSVNIPDYGIVHVEVIGKLRPGKKIYSTMRINLPENAKGTHLVLVEAAGLGAHDSEERTFTVEKQAIPNIELVVFGDEMMPEIEHKGFFARIIDWFLNLFRAIF